MSAEEKAGLDRRKFLRMAGAAAGAGTILSTPFLAQYANQEGAAQVFSYLGARKTFGPAPRGTPLIPIRATADGSLEGVPSLNSDHSLAWYRFCGRSKAPGLSPGYSGDNLLRYYESPERLKASTRELGETPWWAD